VIESSFLLEDGASFDMDDFDTERTADKAADAEY
jgi:hypothetical protein